MESFGGFDEMEIHLDDVVISEIRRQLPVLTGIGLEAVGSVFAAFRSRESAKLTLQYAVACESVNDYIPHPKEYSLTVREHRPSNNYGNNDDDMEATFESRQPPLNFLNSLFKRIRKFRSLVIDTTLLNADCKELTAPLLSSLLDALTAARSVQFRQLNFLKSLQCDVDITDLNGHRLIELCANRSLRRLSIWLSDSAENDCSRCILEAVALCRSLRTLTVSVLDKEQTGLAAAHLRDYLKCSEIRHLKLTLASDRYFPSTWFGDSLASCSSLIKLEVDDHCLKALADPSAARVLARLRFLRLFAATIGPRVVLRSDKQAVLMRPIFAALSRQCHFSVNGGHLRRWLRLAHETGRLIRVERQTEDADYVESQLFILTDDREFAAVSIDQHPSRASSLLLRHGRGNVELKMSPATRTALCNFP